MFQNYLGICIGGGGGGSDDIIIIIIMSMGVRLHL
jgi:hypothetical protein